MFISSTVVGYSVYWDGNLKLWYLNTYNKTINLCRKENYIYIVCPLSLRIPPFFQFGASWKPTAFLQGDPVFTLIPYLVIIEESFLNVTTYVCMNMKAKSASLVK